MKKAVLLAAVAAGLAAGAALGVFVPRWLAPGTPPPQAAASSAAKPSATPVAPVRVEVAAVKEIPFSRGLSAVGSLRSDESVVLRPEVAGRIHFLTAPGKEPVTLHFEEPGIVYSTRQYGIVRPGNTCAVVASPQSGHFA